jgi:hypothetical protein
MKMHNIAKQDTPAVLMSPASLPILTLLILVLIWMAMPLQAAELDPGAGRPEDDAYAAKVWAYMQSNQLIGEQRMRSFPFVGSRPHGSIQEIIATEAMIDGQLGRLIVKHNYGAKEGLNPKDVYAAKESENYEALTIMFQRQAGYDPDNNDWFWAEYKTDGSVLNYQGQQLSGRAPVCLGCHTPLGGKDREILNGNTR